MTPSTAAAATPLIPPPCCSYAVFMLFSFSLTVSLAACNTVPAVCFTLFQHSDAFSLIAVSFPPVAVSMALNAPVTTPFSAFKGASANDFSALNAPRKMFFSPSSALLQSPVNTPATKSMIPWNTCFTPSITPLTVVHHPSNTPLINSKATGNLSLKPSTALQTASFNAENFAEIHSPSCPAFSFTVSQFLYSNAPIAITAPIARITKPIGLVKNVNAAPSAVVTAVAAVQTTFHAVVAAVCAHVAAVDAAFTIASLAYSAFRYNVSALSFILATRSSVIALVTFAISIAVFASLNPAMAVASVVTVGIKPFHSTNLSSTFAAAPSTSKSAPTSAGSPPLTRLLASSLAPPKASENFCCTSDNKSMIACSCGSCSAIVSFNPPRVASAVLPIHPMNDWKSSHRFWITPRNVCTLPGSSTPKSSDSVDENASEKL